MIGGGNLLSALESKLPERAWKVPCGGGTREQAEFLVSNPPPRNRGIVFTDQAGEWMRVSQAGWRVYWCEASQVPIGAMPLPDEALDGSIMDLAKRFWGATIVDKRLVGDVMLGRREQMGTLLYVTSMSGGVGKTVTSRRLCERASTQGIPTLLVDGNMLQSSQRSFFDPEHRLDVRSITDWQIGQRPQNGANQGKRFGLQYDISFAPATGDSVPWSRYVEYIQAARKVWAFVVVDLDRISAADLSEPDTAASELLVPSVRSGDLVLFAVKAGRQTQGDAMNVFVTLPSHGLPRECVGIKDCVSVGMSDYTQYDYSRYGTFLGVEHQSNEAGERISRGESNWSDPQLDQVREQVLAWAMPDKGFDPSRFAAAEKKRRWFF